MNRIIRFGLATAAAVLAITIASRSATAQVMEGPQTNKYLELLRQDLRTQKTAIVTEAMNLTDAQAEIFWPIYDEYSSEMRQVWDGRIANIKDYAENFERMTNDKAKQIADRAFKLDDQRGKVMKKYYNRYAKALDPMTAGRFVQIESALYDLISLQLAAELPLMK
jgi:Spy/CpxP family protein refolding chaperone